MGIEPISNSIRKPALGRTAARGVAYQASAQAFKIFMTVVSTAVVARILTPDDYGVIAMTAPLTGFILIFQNLGLNQAVIQSRSLTEEQTNALFFYNMAASATIAAILLLVSPLVGWFYADSRPAEIVAASALTVLISGSALQHTALLTRNMRFRALSVVDVAATAVTFLCTFLWALLLQSYWSLWLGTFCGAVVSASLLWHFDRWRPNRHVVWSSARDQIRFGTNLTGFNLLNFLIRNVDHVLIAKAWGPASLGLYDRSYKLMMFPISNINYPLTRVVLPALVKVRDEPERFRRVYVLAIRALALGSIPGIMAAAMLSDRLVPLILGERWMAASPIFFWLSLAAITQPITSSTGWLFMATGRAREMLRWAMLAAPVTIASFLIGLPWGPEGVAAAYFFGQVLLVPLLYLWCARGTPVRASDLYGAILPTLGGGIAAWVIVHQAASVVPTAGLIALALFLSYGFSIAAQTGTKEGRLALRKLVELLRSLFPHRQKAS